MRKVLDEEARAGWTMVEKFDDSRVRLKRPASARAGDATLGFDPHRSFVGVSQVYLIVFAMLGALAIAGIGILLSLNLLSPR